jgi:hypothetical protein
MESAIRLSMLILLDIESITARFCPRVTDDKRRKNKPVNMIFLNISESKFKSTEMVFFKTD